MSKLSALHLVIVAVFTGAVFFAHGCAAPDVATDADPYWVPVNTRPLVP